MAAHTRVEASEEEEGCAGSGEEGGGLGEGIKLVSYGTYGFSDSFCQNSKATMTRIKGIMCNSKKLTMALQIRTNDDIYAVSKLIHCHLQIIFLIYKYEIRKQLMG
jgi:hypothetical protein